MSAQSTPYRLHKQVNEILRSSFKPPRGRVPNPDDQVLIDAELEYLRVAAMCHDTHPETQIGEEEITRLDRRRHRIKDFILDTPAAGLRGAAVQIRMLLDPNEGVDLNSPSEERAARSILAVLEREEPGPRHKFTPYRPPSSKTTPASAVRIARGKPRRVPGIYWYDRRERGIVQFGDHEISIDLQFARAWAEAKEDRWVVRHWWPGMPKDAAGVPLWPAYYPGHPDVNNCTSHHATREEAVAAVKAIISSLMAAPEGNVIPLLPRSTDEPGPNAA